MPEYDPNQPRDAEGKWTDAGDAIRKAASDKKLNAPDNIILTSEEIERFGKKISVSRDNTYLGRDMEWTERQTDKRVLDEEEVFYHFSRYDPDEFGAFAPKETAFFDSKLTSSGHVYRYTATKGTVVKEYSNETRINLKEGEHLIYLGVTKNEKTGKIVNKGVGDFEETKKVFRFSDELVNKVLKNRRTG